MSSCPNTVFQSEFKFDILAMKWSRASLLAGLSLEQHHTKKQSIRKEEENPKKSKCHNPTKTKQSPTFPSFLFLLFPP